MVVNEKFRMLPKRGFGNIKGVGRYSGMPTRSTISTQIGANATGDYRGELDALAAISAGFRLQYRFRTVPRQQIRATPEPHSGASDQTGKFEFLRNARAKPEDETLCAGG